MEKNEKDLAKKIAESDELTDIALYAKELEERLKAKEAELADLKVKQESENDTAVAKEDSLAEELEDAWMEAEQRAKETTILKERAENYFTQMMKSDKKAEILSIALAKSLEFIASLSGVISEALK